MKSVGDLEGYGNPATRKGKDADARLADKLGEKGGQLTARVRPVVEMH